MLYAIAATISYHQHFDDARDRLRRNLAIVHEHAQKVFETFEFASRYLDEITGNATDEQIRANEASYSERLRAMTASMPQLRDLWIIGADGYPLVSGTVFPMPRDRSLGPQLFQGSSRQPGERARTSPRCWTPAPPTPVSSRSAASAKSTAGSPASPSFRSRRSISASSIPSFRRPGPRRCCAPTARCWPAIRIIPARNRRAAARCRRFMTADPDTTEVRASSRAVRDRRPHPHLHLPATGEAAGSLRHGRRREPTPSCAPGCSPWRAI